MVPEELGHLIKMVQHRHHRSLDTELAKIGISLVQWNALREIARNPGASMHRLSELTFNSDQAFGTLAARLLKMGLIDRQENVGRKLSHVLTERGQTLFRQGEAIHRNVIERSFSALSQDERATLCQLLSRIAST
jgi:DNA-binding MarR family transcriptional regulator